MEPRQLHAGDRLRNEAHTWIVVEADKLGVVLRHDRGGPAFRLTPGQFQAFCTLNHVRVDRSGGAPAPDVGT